MFFPPPGLEQLFERLVTAQRATLANFSPAHAADIKYLICMDYGLHLHMDPALQVFLSDGSLLMSCREGVYQFLSEDLRGARLVLRDEFLDFVIKGERRPRPANWKTLEVRSPWRVPNYGPAEGDEEGDETRKLESAPKP